jgi:tetratricopeptide (TPR) repeat protein
VTQANRETSVDVLLELLDELTEVIATVESFEELPTRLRRDVRASLEELAREALRLARDLPVHREADEDIRERRALREELLHRALEAIAHERYREAESILFAALEKFPGNAGYYNHLGLISWERGEIARAEEFYARAASAGFPDGDLGPQFSWFDERHADFLRALEGRALCLYQLGRLAEAIPLFETLASTQVPEYAGCRYLAGEVRHTMGELEAALRDYRRAPLEPAVLYNRALVLFELGDLEEAAAQFIRAFCTNRSICDLLLHRAPHPGCGEFEGFLGSEEYAEEFLEACLGLWRGKRAALEFMERCYDHPLVQHHLRVGWATSTAPSGASGPADSEEPVDEQQALRGLARRVLEHLVV